MKKAIDLTIRNKLVMEKRDIVVYHHSTRGSHMISVDSAVTFPLMSVLEGDYLHISIVGGPGNLENTNVADLPSWADFEVYSNQTIAVFHAGDRTIVKLPPGTSPWQLKITRLRRSTVGCVSDSVIIGDRQDGNFQDNHSQYTK